MMDDRLPDRPPIDTTNAPARAPAPAPGSGRVMSIDALRGFDMFWIIGGHDLILAVAALIASPIPEAVRKQPGDNAWSEEIIYHPEQAIDVHREPVVRELSGPGPAMLFDVDADPGERHDVAADHPARAAAMSRATDEWFGTMVREWQGVREANLKPPARSSA